MADYPPDQFDVDLFERKVVHKPSGIWFSFYEYPTEDDWRRSDNVVFRDDPRWEGDRMALARAAKAAALKAHMTARKPQREPASPTAR